LIKAIVKPTPSFSPIFSLSRQPGGALDPMKKQQALHHVGDK